MFPALISWKEVNISLNNPATITMHSPHNIYSIFANVEKNGRGTGERFNLDQDMNIIFEIPSTDTLFFSDHLKRRTNASPLIAFPKSKYLQILVN